MTTKTMTKLDTAQLVTVTGGVRPGPNGEGCTTPRDKLGTPIAPLPNPLGNLDRLGPLR